MSGNVGSETGDSGSGEGEGDDSCTGSGTGSGSGTGFFRRLLGFLAGVGAGATTAALPGTVNVGMIKKVNPSQHLYTIVLLIDLRLYPFVLRCAAYNELKEILVYLYDASAAAFFRASFSF